MSKVCAVFVVSSYNNEMLEDSLVFSTSDLAYQSMENEYLNQLDDLDPDSICDHSIDAEEAMIQTGDETFLWKLNECVIDSFVVQRDTENA